MLNRGRMMGHLAPIMLNNAMHGRMALPSPPPGFRPGMNQVRFPPPPYQPPPYGFPKPSYQQHQFHENNQFHVMGQQQRMGPVGGGREFGGYQGHFMEREAPPQYSDDPYAGLMTQREKDWLVRIQLLQVQPENPEVDDYYYVMFAKKKSEQKEPTNKDSGDGDRLRFLRPERVRSESKNYTPIQFERSLGKLQVVSVNYPRKILDMGVQRLSEEEDRKVPPDRDLLWFRQLMLDIEKMYTLVLEHEDNTCSAERKQELAERLFVELQPSEDRFVQLVGVRKGRALVFRVLPILRKEHQVKVLEALLRHLSWLLRKDRLDGVLERGLLCALEVARKASLDEVQLLADSLLANPDPTFLTIFATHMSCSLVQRAEELFVEETAKGGEQCKEGNWRKSVTLMAYHLTVFLKSHEGEENESPVRFLDGYCAPVSAHLRRFQLYPNLVETLSQTEHQNGFSDLSTPISVSLD